MPSAARSEAERLVATVLAMAEQGGAGPDLPLSGTDALHTVADVVGRLAGGRRGGAWATGDPECCVCPVCRAIAAARHPTPENAARLASSAGDLATGVASALRAVSTLAGAGSPRRRSPRRPASPPPPPGDAWSTATRSATVAPAADRPSAAADRPPAASPAADRPSPASPAADRPSPASSAADRPSPAASAADRPSPAASAGPAPDVPGTRPAPLPSSAADPWAAATRAARGDAESPAAPDPRTP
jgi:hypothetical protein